jgi:hypothetical protein
VYIVKRERKGFGKYAPHNTTNNESLPSIAPGRDQSGGWEFATLSFPGWHWAPHGLPASRRYSPRQAEFRPHSRAVQRLAVAEFLSEASKLALAGVCSAGLRTR